MKREEAKKEFMKDNQFRGGYILPEGVENRGIDIINKIYNSLERRICSNCKYNVEEKCNANESIIVFLDIATFDDFGCNKFEIK